MFTWLTEFFVRKTKAAKTTWLHIRFPPESVDRIRAVLRQSSWRTELQIIQEAFYVSEAVYEHGTLTLTVVDGEIHMIVDGGPDGGSKVHKRVIEVDFSQKAA